MRQVCVWKVSGVPYRIVDDPMLLGHDAERHNPNTEMRASKIVGKPDLIYFNNNIEARSKITNIINEIIFYVLSKRERRHPAATHCCLCNCLLAAISTNLCQLPCIGR
jgi:hypothetical protein